MLFPLLRYVLMAAVRDRLFLSITGILVLVMCLSYFFGSSVLTEQDRFAMSFAAFGFRLFGVISLTLFVINYLRRCFEARDIEYLLSRPVGRISFVFAHSLAFSLIALIVAGLLSAMVVYLNISRDEPGVYLWCISLAAEFIIMVNVAMFFAFVLTSATMCMLITAAFYLLCRLIGEILGILERGHTKFIDILGKVMEVISIFIPRLDLMGDSRWILYGLPSEISFPFVIGQCGIFVALVVAATAIDMNRRQF